ncbi:RHO protein GDP dissociation inhibitor containing protein [Pochonia chlamydosporia 170]|uniref:Rho GDP-dissociation inhibitor n=1 Tax=Pochonia chlamydosporia 170 TaxID=1380566 RepID=A0A179FTB8_METCM|nr:RHO protein GDP dissociation inhibitor containing protein [Pochonia chlamydosporia 170]OAQ68824.1 RHO protein GDP dissociation inhibitor containing protein [Pochonia chlamydosporia 170]
MASHVDDSMPEETQGYKLSQPKQSLADYQKMGKSIPILPSCQPSKLLVEIPPRELDEGDESLQRYKASLGLGSGKDISDPNDPRVCIIIALTMHTPGRDPVTIDLSTPGSEKILKDKPFKIKEGSKFSMTATFKVQHEILSGLHYVQIVKRKGIKVSKDSEMIGSYAPNTDKQPTYTKTFQEEEAPSGMLARGHYSTVSSFVDDDKKKHLEFEWSFDIAKDW